MMERMKNDVFIVSIDDWLKLNTNGKSIYTQLRLTPGSRFYRVRAVNEENASIQSNPDELFYHPCYCWHGRSVDILRNITIRNINMKS